MNTPNLIKPNPLRFRFNHILNCWEQYGFHRNSYTPIWKWFIVPMHWVKECMDKKCADICVEETVS
jgi:hypothetical protein